MSTYEIEIQEEIEAVDFPYERIAEAIRYILAGHHVADRTGVTVVVSSDEHVRQLNAEFRKVDAPTDILSFPADPLPAEIEDEPPYLGDLIIAYPYTVHQAEESGHNLTNELVLLAVHGTLHLLGYDHDNTEHQETMWQEQAQILKALGVPIEVPRFTFGDDGGY